MSAGVEGRGGRDAHSGTGLAPGHPTRRPHRPAARIPTSPVTATPSGEEPASTGKAAGSSPADRTGADRTGSGHASDDPAPAPGAGDHLPSEGLEPPEEAEVVPHRPDLVSGQHHHHHVLIEPEEDRWAWRRRIRQNPHQLRIYRGVIGLVGVLLICLGLVTGPLPGPGGIPLVLLGLAVWSSEFEWAYRLRLRVWDQIHRYGGWPTRRKIIFWIVFALVCAGLGYSYLLVLGVPFWMPDAGAQLLHHLPGVDAGS